MNPNSNVEKGTGNFMIETYSQQTNLIDQNKNFGTISIDAQSLLVFGTNQPLDIKTARNINPKCKIENDGTTLGGQQTNYVINFQNAVALEIGSWFRFRFPVEYDTTKFGNIICNLIDENQKVYSLSCVADGYNLLIKGLTVKLNVPSAGKFLRIKLINVFNPYRDGFTDVFYLQTMKPGINTIIEHFRLAGTIITPGQIFNPIIKGYPLNLNQYIDYTISFTPMNHLFQNGKMIITFPTQYASLAPNCRVQKGLTAKSTTNPISCVAVGKEITISNFDSFRAQYVEIKIFATNPSVSTPTDHFIIQTKINVGGTDYIVDKNTQCGQLTMADIKKPLFQQIDLYTILIERGLGLSGPLDFRLYPNKPNVLPQTKNGAIGEIFFQLPLWWMNNGMNYAAQNVGMDVKGNNPLCIFGKHQANRCDFTSRYGAIFPLAYLIATPSTDDLQNRYSNVITSNLGLGECDLPVSIQNVVVSPIPGKYNFRSLTFKTTSMVGFNTHPLEMDQYTMEIKTTVFPGVNTVYSSSTVTEDPYTLIRASFQVGLELPIEGAINLNFTVTDDIQNNIAGWPQDLGFNFGANTYKSIPCRIQVGGIVVGYAGTSHPNVGCLVFKGDLVNNKNPIIQVRGFSSKISTNTNIEIDVVNIKFCKTVNMQCYAKLSTSFTQTITDPYTLNEQTFLLGQIIASSFVTTANGVSVSMNPTEICKVSTWTFTFNSLASLSTGDIIILEFPSDKFYFKRIGASSNLDSKVDIVVDQANKINYYIVELQSGLVQSSTASFTLSGIRNAQTIDPTDASFHFPTAPFTGIQVTIDYFKKNSGVSIQKSNINKFTFPFSPQFTDGGIRLNKIEIYPTWRSIEYDSWIIHKLKFETCNTIPAAGAITITVPFANTNFYADVSTTCQIYSGLTSDAIGLQQKMTCIRTGSVFKLVDFKEVLPYTSIELIMQFKTKLADTTPTNWFVQTWLDKTKAFTAHQTDPSILNELDYLNSGVTPPVMQAATKASSGLKGRSIPYLVQGALKQQLERARVGTRGSLHVQITPVNNILSTDYLYVMLSQDTFSIDPIATLECIINNQLSSSCVSDGFTDPNTNVVYRRIKAQMPQQPTPMTHNSGVVLDLYITTKGIDYSATQKEGLSWAKAGKHETRVQIVDTSNSIREFNSYMVEILPKSFNKFWVFSVSKLRSQSTAQTDTTKDCSYDLNAEIQCGYSKYMFYMQTTEDIPASDDVTQPRIFVEFSRVVKADQTTTYSTGFSKDLGTGIVNGRQIPCEAVGITTINNAQLYCKLLHGVKPFKTRIMLTNFQAIPASTNVEIHIPGIFNPDAKFQWVETQVTVKKLVNNVNTPILQNSYAIINNTYELGATDYPKVVSQTLTTGDVSAPTFDLNTVDTQTNLNLQVFSSVHNLGPSDYLIFTFPKTWQILQTCTTSFGSTGSKCAGSPSGYSVSIELAAGITAGAKTTGYILMKTPMFIYLTPPPGEVIKGFVYSRSKLVNRFVYPQLATSLVQKDITPVVLTPSDDVISHKADWAVEATILHMIPIGAVIIIEIPSEFTIIDNICLNDYPGGSKLNSETFTCAQIGATQQFKINVGTPGLTTANLKIRIRFGLTNPSSTTVTNKWKIYIYYEDETPLNKLMSKNEAINTPALKSSPTVPNANQFWNIQYTIDRIIHVSEKQPFIFQFMSGQAIAAGVPSVDYFEVTFPAEFTFIAGYQLVAYYTTDSSRDLGYNVIRTGQVLKIYPPQTVTLTLDTLYNMVITTINSDDGTIGIQYPSTQNTYVVNIKFYKNGVLTHDQNVNVFVPAKDFTLFSSSSMIVQKNQKTHIRVYLKPSVAIPTSGKLILYIPVVNSINGQDLFDNDLGSGVADNGNLYCNGLSNIVGTLTCNIKHGNRLTSTDAQIIISGWSSTLTTANIASFFISQIKTPSSGNGFKHVYTRLESYDGSNVIINSAINYDFTIIDTAAITEESISTTLFSDGSQTAGQITPSFIMDIKSPELLQPDNMNDFIVIIFDPSFFAPLATGFCTCPNDYTCYLDPGYNWIVLEPKSVNIQANAAKVLTLTNCKQAIINDATGIKMRSMAIQRRKVLKTYVYKGYQIAISNNVNAIFNVEAQDVGVSQSLNINPTDQQKSYLLHIQTPTGLTITPGVIVIEFPTQFTLNQNDYICYNAHDSQLIPESNFDCKVDSTNQKFLITGYKTLTPQIIIKLIVIIQNPSATLSNPSFVMKIYSDIGQANLALTKTTSYPNPSPYIQTIPTFKQAFFVNDREQKMISLNDKSEFVVEFNMQSSPSGISYIEIIDQNNGMTLNADQQIECIFGQNGNLIYKASLCKYTHDGVTSKNTIQAYLPHSPTLTQNQVYQLKLTTRCSNDHTQKGIAFTRAGQFLITSKLYVNGGLVFTDEYKYVVHSTKFTSLKVDWLYSNKNIDTSMIVQLQPSILIPDTGFIRLKLPQRNKDRSKVLFENQQISKVKVYGISGITSKYSQLIYSVENGYDFSLMIEIKGFQQISTSSNVVLLICGLTNPDLSNHSPVDLYVESYQDSGMTMLDHGLVSNIMTASNFPSIIEQSFTLTMTNANIQQNNVQYTMNGIGNVIGLNRYSYVVFEFPQSYSLSTASVSIVPGGITGSLEIYHHIMIYRFNLDVTATSLTFQFSQLTNSIAQDNSKIYAYVVKSHYYIAKYAASPSYSVPNSNELVFAIEQTSHRYSGLIAQMRISISHSKTIPAGGFIEIKFPTAVTWNIKNVIVFEGLPNLSNVNINGQTIELTLADKDYLATMGNIKLYLEVTYPAAASYAYSDFKVITYLDSTKTHKILENTHSTASGTQFRIDADDITSYNADLVECGGTFSATDNEDDVTDIYVYFKTTISQIAQTNVKVQVFSVFEFFNNQMDFSSTTILTPTFFSFTSVTSSQNANEYNIQQGQQTIVNLLSTSSYQIAKVKGVKTTQKISSIMLRIQTTGSSIVNQKCYLSIQSIKGKKQTSITTFLSHKTVNQVNYFYTQFTASINVVNNYYIEGVFEFIDLGGQWPTKVGYSSVYQIPCKSPQFTSMECYLVPKDGVYPHDRVIAKNVNSLTQNTQYQFWIYRFYNPTTTKRVTISFSIVDRSIGNYYKPLLTTTHSQLDGVTMVNNVVSSTQDSVAFVVNDNKHQMISGDQFQISTTVSALSGDKAVLYFQVYNINYLPSSSSNPVQVPSGCTFDKYGYMVTCDISSAGVFALNLLYIPLPPHRTTDHFPYLYLIRNGEILEKRKKSFSYSNTNFVQNTFQQFYPIRNYDSNKYLVKMHVYLFNYVPKDGYLEIDISAYTNPKLIGYKYYYSEYYSSGDIKVKMENRKLIVYGFNKLGKKFNYVHLMLQDVPGTINAVAKSYACLDDTNSWIEFSPNTPITLTANYKFGLVTQFQYQMTVPNYNLAGSHGQIGLVIEPSTAITKTQFIKITKITGNNFDFSGRPTNIQCLISDYDQQFNQQQLMISQDCYIDTNNYYILIRTPYDLDLAVSKAYLIQIYFRNSNNQFLYPTNQRYQYIVSVEDQEKTTNYLSYQMVNQDVYKSVGGGCLVQNLQMQSEYISQEVRFRVKTSVPASSSGGFIQVMLYTTKSVSTSIATLYQFDLGMKTNSINIQNDLGCVFLSGITAEAGKTLQCQLIYGSNARLNLPVVINVINFNTVASGTEVVFNIKKHQLSTQANTILKQSIYTFSGSDYKTTKVPLDFYHYDYAAYTVPYSAVSQGGSSNVLTVTPLTIGLANQFSVTKTFSTISLYKYDGIYLKVKNNIFTHVNTIGAQLSGNNMDVQYLSADEIYIYIPNSYSSTVSSTITYAISNFINPFTPGAQTVEMDVKLIYQGKYHDWTTISKSITFVTPSQIFTYPVSAWQSPNILKETNQKYLLTVTFVFLCPKNGGVLLEAPAAFTSIQSNFKIVEGYTGSQTSTLAGQQMQIVIAADIAYNSQIKIQFEAISPNTQGQTDFFKIACYKTNSFLPADLVAQDTQVAKLNVLAIGNFKQLNFDYARTEKLQIQAYDYGMFRMQYTATSNLNKASQIQIQMTGGTWTSTAKSTMFKELKVNSIYYDDIQCWFGDQIADDCIINNLGVLVNGPNSQTVSNGAVLYLKVETVRARIHGFTSENFQYPAKNDYDFQIGSTTKKLKVENQRFTIFHQNSLMTNSNKKTILQISIDPQEAVGTNVNKQNADGDSIIRIKLQTFDSYGNDLFLQDLGTGIKHDCTIDCYCKLCGTKPKCTISYGRLKMINQPVELIIYPQSGLSPSTKYTFKFPKVTVSNNLKPIVMLSQVQHDKKVAGSWVIQQIHFTSYIFYITQYSLSTQTNVAAPVFSVNKVGQTETLTFTFNNDITLKQNTVDRIVIYTDTTDFMFIDKTTSCTNFELSMYQTNKWIELKPTAANVATGTVSLAISNFVNMPYVIPTGVKFYLKTWVDGNYHKLYTFQNTLSANPNIINNKDLSPVMVTIQQQTQYTLKFQPFNKVPADGLIYVYMPKCAGCNWQFPLSYCEALNVVYYDCQCISDTVNNDHYLKIILEQDYDPTKQIKLTFWAQNPSTVVTGYSYFIVKTYWKNTGTQLSPVYNLIDQDLQFDVANQWKIQGGIILGLVIQEVYQNHLALCAGQVGPIEITFQLQIGTILNYPTDYVSISEGNGGVAQMPFNQAVTTDLFICMWTKVGDSNYYNVKTFRCEKTGGFINIYVPEELKTITSGQQYKLTITDRYQKGGITLQNPSGKYYFIFDTNKGTDRQLIGIDVPACPFSSSTFGPPYSNPSASEFYVETMSNQISKTLDNDINVNDPTWTTVQFSIKSQINPIPSGKISSSTRSRMLIKLPNHNTIKNSWDPYLGYGPQLNPLTTKQTEISCGGIDFRDRTGQIQLQPASGETAVKCTYIATLAGQTYGTILIENYDAISSNTNFDFFIAKIGNPSTASTFTHLTIEIESIQADGQFTKIYEHTVYYIGGTYAQAPNGGAGLKSMLGSDGTAMFGKYNNYVSFNMGRKDFYLQESQVSLNAGTLLQIIYDYPYNGVTKMTCNQFQVGEYDYVNAVNFPVKKGMCGSSYSVSQTTDLQYSQRVTNIWNIVSPIQPTYQKMHVKDTAYKWFNPPAEYKSTGGTAKSKYYWLVYKNKQVQLYKYSEQSPDKRPPYIVLQSASATNPINLQQKYQLGIYLYTTTSEMGYMIMKVTKGSFANIAGTCSIRRGLVLIDVFNPTNQISCVVTSDSNHWIIEIQNFGLYYGDGFIIVELDITNKATNGWTDYFSIIAYRNKAESQTAIPRIINDNQSAGGRIYIGAPVIQSQYFRVYKNTVSFEDRRAQKNQYAELHMRMKNQITLPSTTGGTNARVEIWLPIDYDIPNGGVVKCTIGASDHISHDNIHKDNLGQMCSISSTKKVTVYTDDTYGLIGGDTNGKCTLTQVTTEQSIGNNGFKMPPTTSTKSFEVYNYIGNDLKEYSVAKPAAKPQVLASSDFSIITRMKEEYYGSFSTTFNQMSHSVVEVKFKASVIIPAGYDSNPTETDPTKKNPIGEILVRFNTKDVFVNGYWGFPLDLDIPNQYSLNVPCKAVTGLVPQSGKTIKCTLIKSTQVSIFHPVQVKISEFNQISKDSWVEIHLIQIGNIRNRRNNGQVSVYVQQLLGDGSYTELIKESIKYQKVSYKSSITRTDIASGVDLIIQPSVDNVGEYIQMQFGIPIPQTLSQDDYIVFRFPYNYELKYLSDNKVYGSIRYTQSGASVTLSLITRIYATNDQVNTIHLVIPTGSTVGTQAKAQVFISQIRNSAYSSSGAANYVDVTVVRSNLRLNLLRFLGIGLPTKGALFNYKLMSLSSYFANDIYVEYLFQIVTTYRVPVSSRITIYMPDIGTLSYSHLGTSNPVETCTVSTTAITTTNCIPSANPRNLVLNVATEISEGTAITIQIKGAKNPAYVGVVAADKYKIEIERPVGLVYQKINTDYFNSIEFYTAKSVGTLYLLMQSTNLYQGVLCDYTFRLQNTKVLPIKGIITLLFPSDFKNQVNTNVGQQTTLTGEWTTTNLNYVLSYNQGTGLLSITADFEWPSGNTLIITIQGITNPSITNTGIFQSNTQYDGVTLDQTDAADTSLAFTYLQMTQQITVHRPGNNQNYEFMRPSNQAEMSSFKLILEYPANIPAGSKLLIVFPQEYEPSLSKSFMEVYCKALSNINIQSCQAKDRQIQIEIGSAITANTKFEIELKNVMNPNKKSSNNVFKYDLTLLDKNQQVLSYVNNAFSYTPKDSPQQLEFHKLTSSSTNLQERSDFSFCVKAKESISQTAEVSIEFPNQFTFLSSQYTCKINTTTHNAITYPNDQPTCQINNKAKKIVISGQSSGFTKGNANNMLCYIIGNVENPSDSGQSDNFSFSIYEPSTNVVTGRTYGTTSYPSTITFSRQKLRILVSPIQKIYRLMMSSLIKVELEQAVSYNVNVTPVSQTQQFTFVPSVIKFTPSTGVIQYFRVVPVKSTPVGQYFISFTKNENTNSTQFAQISDSYFLLDEKTTLNQKIIQNLYRVTIDQTISRTALLGTSLPIKVSLNNPASEPLTVNYITINPSQNSSIIIFSPTTLVFNPGETQKSFTYQSKQGAFSGTIQLSIVAPYDSIFTLEQSLISMEILQIDYNPPEVLNEEIYRLERTRVGIRISTSESVSVYYMLTLKGTNHPTLDEIQNKQLRVQKSTKTDVLEQHGQQYSYISSYTQDYIYYNAYLEFEYLEEHTEYLLYYFIQDLSKINSTLHQIPFTTGQKHYPAEFQLSFKTDYSAELLKNVFSIITGLESTRWQVLQNPSVLNVSGLPQSVIGTQYTTYYFRLLQSVTRNESRPIDQLGLIHQNEYMMIKQIPQLVIPTNVLSTSYQLVKSYQQFYTKPKLVYTTIETAEFEIELKYSGHVYGIVLFKNESFPTSRQIKYALKSNNKKLSQGMFVSIKFVYDETIPTKNIISKKVAFSNLYDSTEYIAYFTAENDLPVNPDLLASSDIQTASFLTKREIFTIPNQYIFGYIPDYFSFSLVLQLPIAIILSSLVI